MKLIRNAVRCKRCNDIIESKTRYDLQQCSCKCIAVDGGLEDARILGNEEDYESLNEWATIDYNTDLTRVDK
jgi:hypothetical protein